jgi:hypothetical protein
LKVNSDSSTSYWSPSYGRISPQLLTCGAKKKTTNSKAILSSRIPSSQINSSGIVLCTHKMHQQDARSLPDAHERRKRATTTRHPAARALRQPCRAPRVLVSRPQRLYIDYTVCRHDVVFWAYDYFDYSSRLVSTRKLVEDGSRDINN